MQDDNRETEKKVKSLTEYQKRLIRIGKDKVQERDKIREKLLTTFPKVEIKNFFQEFYQNQHHFSQDDIEHFEKFKAEFYLNQQQIEIIDNLIQRFSSVGYSIINKIKSFQEDFDIDVFQSSIEISIDDLKQLLRFVQKIKLNSEFGKLVPSLKGEK